MRKTNEQSLKEVLDQLLKAYKLDKGLSTVTIRKAWETQLGITVNKHTKDIGLRDGVLYVTIDSSVIRQELSYAKTKLKELLNKEAGSEIIKDIVLL